MNDPVSARPPFWLGCVGVAGVSVTGPTKAPAGIPVPVTDRPTSVDTALLSAIVEVPAGAVAPASVRGPGTGLPPPSRQVPAGWAGTVCGTQLAGTVDERVVTGARVQLVALGVPGQRGVRAGRLEVHRVAEQRLGRRVRRDRGRGVRRDDRRVREAVAGVGERREGLVEGDVDQAALLERLGPLDLGDDVLEEQVSRVQAAGEVHRGLRRVRVGETAGQVVAVADGVVRVRAVVRRDPAERRRRLGALQVVVQPVGRVEQVRDVVGVAVTGLKDRLEPREREVLGHVLVGRVRAARVGLGRRPGRGRRGERSAAGLGADAVRGAAGVGVVQVLGVALPAHVRGVELVEQRRDRRRVDAAVGAGRRVRAGRRDQLAVVRVGEQRCPWCSPTRRSSCRTGSPPGCRAGSPAR